MSECDFHSPLPLMSTKYDRLTLMYSLLCRRGEKLDPDGRDDEIAGRFLNRDREVSAQNCSSFSSSVARTHLSSFILFYLQILRGSSLALTLTASISTTNPSRLASSPDLEVHRFRLIFYDLTI